MTAFRAFNTRPYNASPFNAGPVTETAADSVTVTDATAKAFTLVLADSVTASDVFTASNTAAIAETVTTSDDVSFAFGLFISDSVTAEDDAQTEFTGAQAIPAGLTGGAIQVGRPAQRHRLDLEDAVKALDWTEHHVAPDFVLTEEEPLIFAAALELV